MQCIYIGRKFYRESSTFMSPVYEVSGERSDWGKIECALEAGDTVTIRPADKDELAKYEVKLEKLKKQQDADQ